MKEKKFRFIFLLGCKNFGKATVTLVTLPKLYLNSGVTTLRLKGVVAGCSKFIKTSLHLRLAVPVHLQAAVTEPHQTAF